MSVAWSNRRNDEPGHPEQPRKVIAVGIDPANPDAISVARVMLRPVSYAESDDEQDDDVIEPTALFKPGEPLPDWSNVEITVTYYD